MTELFSICPEFPTGGHAERARKGLRHFLGHPAKGWFSFWAPFEITKQAECPQKKAEPPVKLCGSKLSTVALNSHQANDNPQSPLVGSCWELPSPFFILLLVTCYPQIMLHNNIFVAQVACYRSNYHSLFDIANIFMTILVESLDFHF